MTLHHALLAGVETLDSLQIRYAIVGGLAVGVWAIPRATQDVDIYAEIPPDAKPALEQALCSHGLHVPAMQEELERFGVFRSRASDGIFLDIFDAVGPYPSIRADHHYIAMNMERRPDATGSYPTPQRPRI